MIILPANAWMHAIMSEKAKVTQQCIGKDRVARGCCKAWHRAQHRVQHLIRGRVWSEEEANSSDFSSSRARIWSSERDTSCRRPSSLVKKAADAA